MCWISCGERHEIVDFWRQKTGCDLNAWAKRVVYPMLLQLRSMPSKCFLSFTSLGWEKIVLTPFQYFPKLIATTARMLGYVDPWRMHEDVWTLLNMQTFQPAMFARGVKITMYRLYASNMWYIYILYGYMYIKKKYIYIYWILTLQWLRTHWMSHWKNPSKTSLPVLHLCLFAGKKVHTQAVVSLVSEGAGLPPIFVAPIKMGPPQNLGGRTSSWVKLRGSEELVKYVEGFVLSLQDVSQDEESPMYR